jgi:hypothetical protein
MRIARLAATLTAAGVLVVAAATPSLAEAEPSINPGTVKAGGTYTAALTDCAEDSASVTTPDDKTHELKGGPPNWSAELSVPEGTEAGDYELSFKCGDADAGTATLTVDEAEAPDFDASISPNPFRAGDRLTLTTTGCATVPTVEDVDGLFTGPLTLKEVGDERHQGSAVTKTNLPSSKVFHLIVTCKGEARITFSTAPGKKAKKQTGDTGAVPVGGVDTGDGSTYRQDNGTAVTPIVTTVSAAALLAVAFGLAYRRRKAREDA